MDFTPTIDDVTTGNDSDEAAAATTTTPTTPSDNLLALAVYGLPGYGFYLIHATGMTSLTCSIFTSITVLTYLNYPFKINFYTRNIGERLVVYLAICDLFYSCSHMMDHIYMVAILNFPPDPACRTFAFFLNEFVLAQNIMVSFTALNAFSMVVLTKKVDLGRYDWRLVILAFGLPAIFGIICEGFQLLGPSGAWCYMDLRQPIGKIMNNVITFMLLFTLILNLVCYLAVFLKMRAVQLKISGGHATSGESTKNHKVARIMMIFVFVYVLQYWAFCVYSVWLVVAQPSIVIMWASVCFSNLGGVFNMLAYTLLRRKTVAVQAGEASVAPPSMMTSKSVVVKSQIP